MANSGSFGIFPAESLEDVEAVVADPFVKLTTTTLMAEEDWMRIVMGVPLTAPNQFFSS